MEDAPRYGGYDTRRPGLLAPGQDATPGFVGGLLGVGMPSFNEQMAERDRVRAGALAAGMPWGQAATQNMEAPLGLMMGMTAPSGGVLRGVRAYHGGPGSNPYHASGAGSIADWRAAPDNPAYFAERPGTASNYALERYPERAAVYPVRLNTENAFVHDQASGFLSNAELIRRARERGNDLVVVRNAYDQPGRFAGGRQAQPETIYIALDGSRIFPEFGGGQ